MSPKNANKKINIQKSYSVHIGSMWSILSSSVQFGPIRPIRSYSVNFGLIRSIKFTLALILCTLV